MMLTKSALTQVKINNLIQSRWSPRAFDRNKKVTDETITTLIEAARWSPSCFNEQPWRFIICVNSNNKAHWQQAFSCLVEKNQTWAKNAPVLILSIAMENFSHNNKPNRWAQYDTGAASISLCLQATALGLISHQMGGFDAQKAREVFKLPDECIPMAMIAVGYQAELTVLADDFKSLEESERSRVPIEKRFYFGQL